MSGNNIDLQDECDLSGSISDAPANSPSNVLDSQVHTIPETQMDTTQPIIVPPSPTQSQNRRSKRLQGVILPDSNSDGKKKQKKKSPAKSKNKSKRNKQHSKKTENTDNLVRCSICMKWTKNRQKKTMDL